jgi:hypothetical protein
VVVPCTGPHSRLKGEVRFREENGTGDVPLMCSKHTIPLYQPPRNKTEMVEHKISPGIGLSDNWVIGNKIFRALQPQIMCVWRQGYKPSNTYFPNTMINDIQWAMTIWQQPERELALPSSEVRTMNNEATQPYSKTKTYSIFHIPDQPYSIFHIRHAFTTLRHNCGSCSRSKITNRSFLRNYWTLNTDLSHTCHLLNRQ